LLLVVVESREIVATRSWQLLGENDTKPVGLHVRMDMTTGEKWARLVDDGADDDDGDDDVGDGGGAVGDPRRRRGGEHHRQRRKRCVVVVVEVEVVVVGDERRRVDEGDDDAGEGLRDDAQGHVPPPSRGIGSLRRSAGDSPDADLFQ
jgi:hypothetical protein